MYSCRCLGSRRPPAAMAARLIVRGAIRWALPTEAPTAEPCGVPQYAAQWATLLKPTDDGTSPLEKRHAALRTARSRTTPVGTRRRVIRDDRGRKLDVIRCPSFASTQSESDHQRGHNAQSKSSHSRFSLRVETQTRRAQTSANMTTTPGHAISNTVSTRGVTAAHCNHPSSTFDSR